MKEKLQNQTQREDKGRDKIRKESRNNGRKIKTKKLGQKRTKIFRN
jgi:hypothetical protein